MSNNKQIAVVIGVGPGLGLAVARKFAKNNFTVIAIARSMQQLETLIPQIDETNKQAFAIAADVTKEDEISSAFKKIRENYGNPEVLIYNAASKFELKGINDIVPKDFMDSWKVSCFGGLLAAQQVLPEMLKKQSGTIIFTGATAATRGSANMAAFAVGKFSQRALAQSMARELGPKGIHVAHVIIDGFIATPATLKKYPDKTLDTFLDPDAIAESYWQLHQQDKTAWTHEIDLRPYSEKF